MRTLSRVVAVMRLSVGVQILPVFGASDYLVRSPDLTNELSSQGQIVGVLVAKKKVRWNFHGQTELEGCRVEGLVPSEKGQDGAVRFKKRLLCNAEQLPREVHLVKVFTPTNLSVQWEMELDGMGLAWSTRIETRLHVPDVKTKKFWTTWGDPRPDANVEPSWSWLIGAATFV